MIISSRVHETGRFFGEVNGAIMMRLVEERVYKRVIVYDYQAVCFESKTEINASNTLLSVSKRTRTKFIELGSFALYLTTRKFILLLKFTLS